MEINFIIVCIIIFAAMALGFFISQFITMNAIGQDISLLKKYMAHVQSMTGSTFVSDVNQLLHPENYFNDRQVKELKEIRKEINES